MAAGSQRLRRLRTGLTFILFVLFTSASNPSAQTRRAFTVLAFEVAADSPGRAADNLTWYRTLRETLQSQLNGPVDMFLEHVPRTEEASLALRDYLRQRYRDQPPDLIIASAASEHQFVLRYRDELFPQTPVVLTVAWRPDDSIRRAGAGLAVVEFGRSIRETLALALRLHPATRQVYVLVGRSPRFVPQLRAELQAIAPHARLDFISESSVPQMIEAVRGVPADSVIVYLNYIQEIRGQTLSELQVAELVSSASPAPVYAFLEMYIGAGVVGGAMITPRAEATQLAALAARVLNGERASNIPIAREKGLRLPRTVGTCPKDAAPERPEDDVPSVRAPHGIDKHPTPRRQAGRCIALRVVHRHVVAGTLRRRF